MNGLGRVRGGAVTSVVAMATKLPLVECVVNHVGTIFVRAVF